MPFLFFCSIPMMTSLKQLDLSDNDLSRDERLSDKLSALTNLETLELSYCGLKKIPDRYVMCYFCQLTFGNKSD